MKSHITVCIFILGFSSMAFASKGLVSIKSEYSVQETVDRFLDVMEKKNLTLFARVSHHENAEKEGLSLRPTEMILFGNPKVGTPLMQCSQKIAIDLPQKVLIWEDKKENVWFSYNNPRYLKKRHGMRACKKEIKKVSIVLDKIGKAVTSKQ